MPTKTKLSAIDRDVEFILEGLPRKCQCGNCKMSRIAARHMKLLARYFGLMDSKTVWSDSETDEAIEIDNQLRKLMEAK